ncbi:MAG: chromosome segregation protein SMC [Oscillospiraceae bacterium]|nr:chromosome segregation protein SMC [Oscillospiraceae bacterium]
MYLESLEMQGFKSFPDKIKLDFHKGLTAVVGPNGSGKSNIGDAVRWVLGEQSSKTLRGGKMEDVIFAGTTQRKPMGFAQVTLNIVNNRGLLQVPADMVSVTRKLYRSGESEYMINGSQVRLKDIYELFMDTGLGREGYAIIGQGRVAEIVSAKSGERREIFEEAAGISKFRYKKAEAERRLSAAQENILRLNDIMGELESRVEPLRIQSEKAAKFLELSDRKKSLEIAVWVKQLDDLKVRLEEISDKILINKGEYDAVEADISRLEAEAEDLQTKMESSSLRIEEMRAKILEAEKSNTQLHSDIAVFENDISHCRETIADIEKQQQTAENSGEENRRIIEEKLALVAKAETDIAETEEKYKSASEEMNKLSQEQESFDSKFSDVNGALGKLYIRQSELKITVTSGDSGKTELAEQLKRCREQEEQLRENGEQLSAEKRETEDGVRMLEEKSGEVNNRVSGLTKLYSGRAEKLALTKKEFEDISFSIRDKEQRIKMLTDLENSMEGFAHSVKQVLKASKTGQLRGVYGSVAQLIKVESNYSLAIETALGGALQNIVVDNEDTAKRGIRLLQESKAGRATFLPVTSVKGNRLAERGLEDCAGFVALAVDIVGFDENLRGVFTSLLGRIVIAEDIDDATVIAKKYGYKFKIVTLDGQVINAGGSFTGGSAARSSGVLTRKNDIEKLEAEKNKLSARIGEVKQSMEKLQAETDKLGFDIEGAKDELREIGEDKIRFESEIKRITSLLEQNESQIEAAEASAKRYSERIEENDRNTAEAKENLRKCEEEIAELEKLAADSEEMRSEIRGKRETLSEKLSEMKLYQLERSKDKDALLTEIKQLEEQFSALGDNSARLAVALEEQKKIISEKEKLIEERKSSLENAADAVSDINAKISEEQSARREMEQKSNEGRVKVRNLIDEREKFSREMTRLEERQNAVQNNYDGIISDMQEQYGMYLSEAREIAVPVEDLLTVQRDLNDVKQKIRGLGNVNVAAIEEYKEVSERYTFMRGQLDDVETSKRELEQLIEELTDNMRRQFSESFNQINENFKEIFVELFGGGRAELTLTDPEDVLESGIEINVAPPGKVIKSLSLLSGGEQAFVAIAIYFAILKIKPAPFCILDEIEAALDDINVVKYAQYLRNFTDTTQFILVTHRRGSMDEADVMYGVTMQEKGISRVLKLDQTSAEIEAN